MEPAVDAHIAAEHPQLADGIEISEEVFESPANLLLEQAENRMHTIAALAVASLASVRRNEVMRS